MVRKQGSLLSSILTSLIAIVFFGVGLYLIFTKTPNAEDPTKKSSSLHNKLVGLLFSAIGIILLFIVWSGKFKYSNRMSGMRPAFWNSNATPGLYISV